MKVQSEKPLMHPKPSSIVDKFGGDFIATERTYRMGIDQRFSRLIAARFAGRRVLETCTGGGFTTMALARVAAHVTTVEIDPRHQEQARQNLDRAGLSDRVTFIAGDVMAAETLAHCQPCDAAFLDPDWAVTGPDHAYRFPQSNTEPPTDALLERILRQISDLALVLPPLIAVAELEGIPAHERQALCLDDRQELYCLYFRALARTLGPSELRL